jgi:hypothetical protein
MGRRRRRGLRRGAEHAAAACGGAEPKNEGAAEAESKRITVMAPMIDDEAITKSLRAKNSWFRGLIPPREFDVIDFSSEYVPYLLLEIWYRRHTKKWRRCFIFINAKSGRRKGVLEVDNISYEEVEAPRDVHHITYDREALEKEIVTYCKLDLLAKNYRKFIDWEIDVHEVRKVYRIKRTARYRVNGRLRAEDVYLDDFALQ